MTDVLRETLEERGRAIPWQDVDSLVAAGDRRVRRRRVAGVVAAAAVVAVLAVVAPLALGGLGTDRAQVAADAYDPAAPSWAVDGIVHVGDLEVDLGEQPGAYVLTEAGVVWIDAAYDVLLTDPSGNTEVLGASEDPFSVSLVTDGRYVGWLDREAEEFVGYDTVSRTVAARRPYTAGGRSSPAEMSQLIALDDGVLWTYDQVGRVNTALDLTRPYREDLALGEDPRNRALLDVAGGAYVREAAGRRVRVETIDGDAGHSVPGKLGAILSPNATYVVTQPRDEFVVYGVEDALPRLEANKDNLFVPVRWLDDETLEYLGSSPDRDGALDVLTCSVSRMSCKTVAEDVAPSSADLTLATGTFSYDSATVQ
jgi:hypothetical protein